MIDVALRTPRLTLTPLTDADLPHLQALDADPEVMRYINGGTPNPPDLVAALWRERMAPWRRDDPQSGFFGAWQDGAFVGWFHLRPDVLEPTWWEVGYRLRRDAWGRGLATEGTIALVAHAERHFPGVPISGRTLPGNLASQRVLEKAGLNKVGTFEFPARTVAGVTVPALPGVLYVRGAP
jgi:RimJ/RimL family protein N-acetyltransferase